MEAKDTIFFRSTRHPLIFEKLELGGKNPGEKFQLFLFFRLIVIYPK